MGRPDIIRRPAAVLCSVAEARGVGDEVGADLDRIAGLFVSAPGLAEAIDNPAAPLSRRELAGTLENACAQPLTREFVRRIAVRRMAQWLPVAADAYRAERERRAGVVRVTLTSAAPLPPQTVARIERWAATGRAGVRTTTTVNPGLIAGFRVRIGDLVHDFSVAARLARARRGLAAAP
ncbi:MAG: hypothetical protein BWK77_07970 [Verrucomicrobia bacterium A1]|nr:MAG: hypothetical protein BWK77_07970 [Verrucomicrobia bacterium A1]